jgi:hypothetical protein
MNLLYNVILITSLFLYAQPLKGQEVTQSKGVDSTIVYGSLKKFGPWDDRNYQLTAEDLKLLAPNEEEVRDPIPAFFRVLLRKNNPNLPKSGPAQYPRSALQIFLQNYGGYLINDTLYTGVKLENGRYVVIEKEGIEYNQWIKKSIDPER